MYSGLHPGWRFEKWSNIGARYPEPDYRLATTIPDLLLDGIGAREPRDSASGLPAPG